MNSTCGTIENNKTFFFADLKFKITLDPEKKKIRRGEVNS